MPDDLLKIAEALDVPLGWLLALALGGFVILVVAVETSSLILGVISCLVGLCFAVLGARALARPSRPLDIRRSLDSGGMSYFNSSRRVGGFYAAAGIVWTAFGLVAAIGS